MEPHLVQHLVCKLSPNHLLLSQQTAVTFSNPAFGVLWSVCQKFLFCVSTNNLAKLQAFGKAVVFGTWSYVRE